jgi:hypothetical protein
MLSTVDRHVIARDRNVVRVDFSGEPDPPTPCFPGANGLRVGESKDETAETIDPALFGVSRLVDRKIRLVSGAILTLDVVVGEPARQAFHYHCAR